MKIAVTLHAVDRYMERVEGAAGFERESVRMVIRDLVREGFELGFVRPHPLDPNRRIIPFQSGSSLMFLSIGPNTTDYDADLAVIGVLFEHEVSLGKIGIGVTLGDVAPRLAQAQATRKRPPRYAIFVGAGDTVETYRRNEKHELDILMKDRRPQQGEVAIYELVDY